MRGYEIKTIEQAQGFIGELLKALRLVQQTAEIAVKMIDKGSIENAKMGLSLLIEGIPDLIVKATIEHGTEISEADAKKLMDENRVNASPMTFSGSSKQTIH